jgi:DNA-binding transcriptional ArsR family regulator
MKLDFDRTVTICNALSTETRARIFFHLFDVKIPQHVGAIAAALSIRDPLASHHLGILENAGLVTSQSSGPYKLYAVNLDTIDKFTKAFCEEQPNETV